MGNYPDEIDDELNGIDPEGVEEFDGMEFDPLDTEEEEVFDDYELVELRYDDSEGVDSFRIVVGDNESALQDRMSLMSVLRSIGASDADGSRINYSVTIDNLILDGYGEVFVTPEGMEKLLHWML
jgi:hypothetical protein